MPNWCNNTIELTHKDSAMIQRAYDAFNRGEFLNEFIPVPKDLSDTVSGFPGEDQRAAHDAQMARNIELYGYRDWYDFCVATWGTKWDVGADGSIRREGANTLHASFESAWAPPCNAYERLAAMGFEIKAYYHEPGMCFAGIWTGNEDDFDDDYYELGGLSSDEVAEAIPSELDEMFAISEDMAQWEEENLEIDLDGGLSAINEQEENK